MGANQRWERANAVANCTCRETGVASVSSPEADWASTFEFWNTPSSGHLIAASLILDGVDCEDLP